MRRLRTHSRPPATFRFVAMKESKFISDLDSTNGTSLNGERLLSNIERREKDGDMISLVKDAVVRRCIDPVSTVCVDAS